jgi:phosphatidate cytidylyltransferase
MGESDIWHKNLVQRVAVAAVGIPVVVAAVVIGGWIFALLVGFVAAVAVWEYAGLVQRREVAPNVPLMVAATVGQVIGVALTGRMLAVVGGTVLGVVLVSWVLQLRRQGSALLNTAATVAGVGYVGGLLSSFVALRRAGELLPEVVPGATVLALLGAIWIGDSAAYAVGRRWGRRALAPRISPRKTWEGAIACFLATALVLWSFLRWWVPALPSLEALWLGLLIGVVGQLGDLAESQLKRDVGVKDSSAFLPGHGGMLDRIDSLLFAAPCLYLWFLLRGWLSP